MMSCSLKLANAFRESVVKQAWVSKDRVALGHVQVVQGISNVQTRRCAVADTEDIMERVRVTEVAMETLDNQVRLQHGVEL